VDDIEHALGSIQAFASTLLADEDGTLFTHSDRLEFYQIIENECEYLKKRLTEVHFRQWHNLVPLRDMLHTYAVSKTQTITCTIDSAIPETPLVYVYPLGRIVMGLIEKGERLASQGKPLILQVELQDSETLRFSFTHPMPSATSKFVALLNERNEKEWSGQLRVSYDIFKVPYGVPWRYIKAEGGQLWYSLGEGPALVTCFTFPITNRTNTVQ